MNTVKKLSVILLLSAGVASFGYAKDSCNDDCFVNNNDSCDRNDCDDNFNDDDCDSNGCNGDSRTSTFFRPRSITTDLTYRNNLSFYNRKHDARCNFFTWDSTFIFQRNRKECDLGAGFLGRNPLRVAESNNPDVAALNLGLTSTLEGGFDSTISISPRREVFAWLPQLYFNLDCFCTGLWGDFSFAVVRAKHRLRFREAVLTPVEPVVDGEPTTIREALDLRNAFSTDCRHTGVDDVLFRLGYDWNYCANDHVGVYFLGLAPTGKEFDNTRWFQPLVGSKHGAVGVGLTGDYTIYTDECNNSDLVFSTELMYQFKFSHDERRLFDLRNGPLSRWLLGAPESNPDDAQSLVDELRTCVRVEPRHHIEWWANLHYQWCNWGAEFSYNLFWRDRERIKNARFDFGELGIFDNTTASPNRTSHSSATIGDTFGIGTCDKTFVRLQPEDVNLCSGAAQRVLTHKLSGAFSYNNVWNDCYPWYVGFGAGYELASRKDRRHAPENWHVYGKWGISF